MRIYILILVLIWCTFLNTINCKNATGVSTKFWKQSDHNEFVKGNAINVALYNNGSIKLAPKTESISGIKASYVWCMANDPYGNIFAGTGNPGIIYKIDKQNKATEIFHALKGLHIQSIVVDQNGTIFFGTSPNGAIYKIDKKMQTSLFCDLPELYIWDLVFDSNGRLFAATGDTGKVYKISADGNMDIVLDSDATHILDLEINNDNVIFACSEPLGLIYKITPEDVVSVLYDAKEDEVHCLTIGNDDTLYAGTANKKKPQMPPSQGGIARMAAKLLVDSSNAFLKDKDNSWIDFGLVNTQTENDLTSDKLNKDKKNQLLNLVPMFQFDNLNMEPNIVYRISPNGSAKEVLKLNKGLVFSLISSNETNNIYVGTGNDANIYQIINPLWKQDNISTKEHIATLFHLESSQILSLLKMDSNAFFVGSGNNGSIFKVLNEFSPNGIYESSVYDASVISKWGRISCINNVTEKSKITLLTRTGNSKVPNSTWSRWETPNEYQPVNDLKSPVNEYSGVIASPSARFIQYRVEFFTNDNSITPTLDSVCISYLTENQAPQFVNIEINDKHFTKNIPTESLEENKDKTTSFAVFKESDRPTKKKLTEKLVTWIINDPDEDEMLFDVYFKEENEMYWCPLVKSVRGQNSYVWQTSDINDGRYQIKVLASDILNNPKGKELQSEMCSQIFLIDNTEPRIENIKVSYIKSSNYIITGTVSDNISNVFSIQYAIDTNDWNSIFPVDELFDYKNEFFQFQGEELSKGKHLVTINAIDSEKNLGSKIIPIEIK